MSFVASPHHISQPGTEILDELRSEFNGDYTQHPEFTSEVSLKDLSDQDIEFIEQEIYEAITNDIADQYDQNVSIEAFEVKIDKETSLVTVTKNEFTVFDNSDDEEDFY